jgi:hypothetical protein
MLYCSYTVYTVSLEMVLVKGVTLEQCASNQLGINARARVIKGRHPSLKRKRRGETSGLGL